MNSTVRTAALAAVASLFVARLAGAQDSPSPPGGDNQGGSPAPAPAPAQPDNGNGSAPGPTTQQGPSYLAPLNTFGNPQSANGTIGGGNATESSSHPVTGEEEDSFDYSKGGAEGPGAVHGGDHGPVFTAGKISGGPMEETPSLYTVQRGDTLWALCGRYLENSYDWPRVWSYNPQIKNPNWIFPGDQIHLRSGEGRSGQTGPASPSTSMGGGMRLPQRVAKDTVFLREQGWIEDNSDEIWGEVSGSADDTMFLSELSEIYVSIGSGHDVNVGQDLTLFQIRQTVAGGDIIQILGTARVDAWDADNHLARAKIIEALDVVERGAKVGPIARSFTVVPPKKNESDVVAHVIAALRPLELFGQNQVVFIDRGSVAGLVPGNRLAIVRRGDAWRDSLATPIAGYRISPDDERPMPPMEMTPGAQGDPKKYPEETIAELLVLSTKDKSAACLVTQSRQEIEAGDRAVATQGY